MRFGASMLRERRRKKSRLPGLSILLLQLVGRKRTLAQVRYLQRLHYSEWGTCNSYTDVLFPLLDGLYTKRFAYEHHRHHQHPLGRPRSLVSDDDEKAQRRAGKAIRAFTAATAAALETQRKERIDKQGGVMRGMARGWANRKKRNTVLFVLFITFFLGPLVGVLLWAMAMRKFDWTPGAGEGY
jgi:hypothetical protein